MYFSASALLQCVSFHQHHSSFENGLNCLVGNAQVTHCFYFDQLFQIEVLNREMPSLGELGVLAFLGGVVGLWGLWAGRGQVMSRTTETIKSKMQQKDIFRLLS